MDNNQRERTLMQKWQFDEGYCNEKPPADNVFYFIGSYTLFNFNGQFETDQRVDYSGWILVDADDSGSQHFTTVYGDYMSDITGKLYGPIPVPSEVQRENAD
jgi:hypothetical protein